MKRTNILFAILAMAVLASAQNRFPPINIYSGDPTGVACTVANSLVQSSATGGIYSCVGGVYVSPAATFNGGTITLAQQQNPGVYSFAGFGDSLMCGGQGFGSSVGSVPFSLQNNLGLSVVNQGVPSNTSTQIAVRQGAVPTHVTVTGGSIPAGATPVQVTIAAGYEPVTSMGGNQGGYGCYNGLGALGTTATLAGVHGTFTYAASLYYFTRDAAGSSVAVTAGTVPVIDAPYTSYFQVIETGENNFTSPTQVLSDDAAMVALLPSPKRYVVESVPVPYGITGGSKTTLLALNASKAAANTGHYVDTMAAMLAGGNGSYALDVLDLAAGVIPASLRAYYEGNVYSGPCTAGATSCVLGNSGGFTPATGYLLFFSSTSNPFAVGAEYAMITSVTLNTPSSGFTTVGLTRGYAGSTAQTWANGSFMGFFDPVHNNASGYAVRAKAIAAYIQSQSNPVVGILDIPAIEAQQPAVTVSGLAKSYLGVNKGFLDFGFGGTRITSNGPNASTPGNVYLTGQSSDASVTANFMQCIGAPGQTGCTFLSRISASEPFFKSEPGALVATGLWDDVGGFQGALIAVSGTLGLGTWPANSSGMESQVDGGAEIIDALGATSQVLLQVNRVNLLTLTASSAALTVPLNGTSASFSGNVSVGTTLLLGDGQGEVSARAMGLKCDGTTDDTAALNAADAYLQSVGGGTLRFPPNAGCKIAGHVVLPNDGVIFTGVGINPYDRQAPITWKGSTGDGRMGQWIGPSAAYKGSQLLLTYGGNGATGGILEQTLFSPGTGYAVGDTGTVAGTCAGTTYRVIAVNDGSYVVGSARSPLIFTGAVEQVYIATDGTTCTVADNTATATGGVQPGTGTGLTLNIAAVVGGDFAKIETYGLGKFEIDGMTLNDPGSDSLPFIRTTGTSLYIHNSEINGTGHTQDAIVEGGSSNAFLTLHNPLAAFQGYGSKIEYNWFRKIRRAMYTQLFSASTVVDSNTLAVGCGSNLPYGAAFESHLAQVDSVSGVPNGGGNGGENQYVNNRIVMSGYPYAWRFTGSNFNYISGSDLDDVQALSQAVISANLNSTYNMALMHFTNALPIIVEDPSSRSSNVIVANAEVTSFPQGVKTESEYGYTVALRDSLKSSSRGVVNGLILKGNVMHAGAPLDDVWDIGTFVASGTDTNSQLLISKVSGTPGTSSVVLGPGIGAILPGATVSAAGAWTFGAAANPTFSGAVYFNAVGPTVRTMTAATAVANQNSPQMLSNGTYWTGSASANESWYWNSNMASGANPLDVLKFMHTGSTGPAAVGVPSVAPTVIYSAALTALPACAVATKGWQAVVSDATTPTYMAAYVSGGAITAEVICSYNGTTYAWLTH